MFDIDEHLENADWAKKTDDTNKALFGQQEERPRMRTREEYARKDHHCGVDVDLSGCPRDEGGKFSSKSSGKGGPIVDKTATTILESDIGGAEDGRTEKDPAAGVGGEKEEATQARAEAGGISERSRVPRGVDELSSSLRSTIEAPALEGLPTKISIPGHDDAKIGPYKTARQAAAVYMDRSGIEYSPPHTYQKVDKDRAAKIANEFDSIKHDPNDPKVKASYQAMIDETVAQWKVIKETGLQVEWITEEMLEESGDPYAATPRLATEDIRRNNHFYVFPTDFGFGSDDELDVSDNPLLTYTEETIGGRKARANDVFRVVHDYFGHVKEGNGFRAGGEENAWRSHSAMYSDLARPAMTMETRGQNSWVNFGPHGETNRTASAEETQYAPQKINILSDWATTEGAGDT
jgi:hypothetical protein